MPAIKVHIRHAGKTYDIQLDPDLPPAVFKDAVYQSTGVPADRMKVMVKGGVLKDDSSWKKIGPKEGQTFTVIGAAGELPKPPEKPIVFLEDMDDSELAEVLAKPVGLSNLGNTCYMNSTIQAFRAIPELQIALSAPALQSETPLPSALRDLYRQMSHSTDSISPSKFLQVLREANPQFAEMDRSEKWANNPLLGGRMYAQQDAEECYSAILNALRNVPGLYTAGVFDMPDPNGRSRFVDQYLMGEMHRELRCDEAPDEPPVTSSEKVLKIECNITSNTNFMLTGIMSSLDQKVEKNSASLGRQAIYSQKSRVSRLPTYLTVQMMRFSWRADISKKAKIMRKVRFPVELDALDLATDDLRAKLLPASRKLKEIEKERVERRKIRTRTKQAPGPAVPADDAPTNASASATRDVEMAEASSTQVATASDATGGENSEAKDKAKDASGEGQEEDEFTVREREAEEFSKLVEESVRLDTGASSTGLYELVAIITHKGAAADAGHYMGFVKRSVFSLAKIQERARGRIVNLPSTPVNVLLRMPEDKMTVKELDEIEGDEDWYKFDDDKVSVFPREKLMTLDGGGEDSSAYVLLYKSKAAKTAID